ncbi:hypothetical protein H8N03_03810 [Ramlibacter sp. USB13]|uniref:Uncharacterized protein n=1 Tax=Ramlibacter cellulosilyticus TaxID=2764187 RepID=A0A923MNR0_9BURK|nr:hypothetical protein [Ramlibacter cellulosilyticus]MBC5782056.1 hypothetical protein [Ramlibacter cellulosilyticus]
MELQIARQIIDTLAQGIHPVTGEAMPEDSPYNAPPVIRALHAVSRALECALAPPGEAPEGGKSRGSPPPNAGKKWTEQEDAALETAYDAGIPLKQVAQELGRTAFAVEQRLVKLGKVEAPAGGGRYGSTAREPLAAYA